MTFLRLVTRLRVACREVLTSIDFNFIMPSCVVPTCKNAAGITKKQDGITFHLFPADEQRKSDWMKIIQRARLDEFWKPSSRSVICSMHFEEQYFYDTKGGLKRLRKTADSKRQYYKKLNQQKGT